MWRFNSGFFFNFRNLKQKHVSDDEEEMKKVY